MAINEKFWNTPGTHSFKVPLNVYSLDVTLWGAGRYGVYGIRDAALPVTPGELLKVVIGANGWNGGFNGGGMGGGNYFYEGPLGSGIFHPWTTNGSGATDVRRNGSRIMVAGGRGGGGGYGLTPFAPYDASQHGGEPILIPSGNGPGQSGNPFYGDIRSPRPLGPPDITGWPGSVPPADVWRVDFAGNSGSDTTGGTAGPNLTYTLQAGYPLYPPDDPADWSVYIGGGGGGYGGGASDGISYGYKINSEWVLIGFDDYSNPIYDWRDIKYHGFTMLQATGGGSWSANTTPIGVPPEARSDYPEILFEDWTTEMIMMDGAALFKWEKEYRAGWHLKRIAWGRTNGW